MPLNISKSILPPLPRILEKNEARVTPIIERAIMADLSFKSCLWEVKYVKGKTLYKGALEPHQRASLLKASMGPGLCHKMSDMGRIKQPADGFLLRRSDAWLFIWYELGPKTHECWGLDISDVPDGKITVEWCRKVGRRVEC